MSVQLDPVVKGRLQQFASRRRTLLMVRGISAAGITFLICLAAAALIDWYWLLTDGQRLAVSSLVYLPAGLMFWWTALRHLSQPAQQTDLARWMEGVEPQLRERLLAAVELSDSDPELMQDSPAFRSLLQGEVAEQMTHLQVPALLPWRLVSRWTMVMSLLLVTAAMLLTTGDQRVRQLAVRAILPMANIARVSRIKVDVLQPVPRSLLLPEDETVAVVVDVTGGSFGDVTLETETASQGVVRQTMRSRSESEFAANIHVQDREVIYRILAGDAITERFTIESRPRPRVLAFSKTFHFPEYSLLPDETRTEADGSLVSLEGTVVDLRLETDQPVARAELRIDPVGSEGGSVVPLLWKKSGDSESGGHLHASVLLSEAALYRVHLVSEETGFENIFSPRYEIRPQPDLVPRAGFVDQQETTLLLPPNDLLQLRGMAEDDLPLDTLEQEISINGEDWVAVALQTSPVEGTSGRQLTAVWDWDLIPLRLRQGDQVLTRLVATDRRGSRGESIPIRVIIADREFNPQRHTLMERKLELQPELASFARLLEQQNAAATEIIDRLRVSADSEQQSQVDRTALLDLAERQREAAADLLARTEAVEQVMPVGVDTHELDLTGRVVARLLTEYSATPAALLQASLLAESEQQRTADLDALKKVFARAADDAGQLAEYYSWMSAWNFVNALAIDMDAMLQHQQLVAGSPTQTFRRLVRQETILVNQLRVIEQLTGKYIAWLPSSFEGRLTALQEWSLNLRDRIQQGMESEDRLGELQATSAHALQQLTQQQNLDSLDGNLPGKLQAAWRELDTRSGSLYVPLEQLAGAARQEMKIRDDAIKADDSEQSEKLLQQAGRQAATIDLQHRRSLDQLRLRRELTRQRRDGNPQYVADSGLALRAFESLLFQHREEVEAETAAHDGMLECAPAWRTLEAGHELMSVLAVLDRLIELERWGSQQMQSRIDHPRHWDLVQQAFDVAVSRLGSAQVENTLIGQLNSTRWSDPARDAGRRIGERRWRRNVLVSAGNELEWMRTEVREVVRGLQPQMAEARAILAKYAPSIADLAEQAAAEVRELEEQTLAAADELEQQSQEEQTPEQRLQLAELEQQQQDVNNLLEDLLQALVEDANQQDITVEEERERARDADDSIAMIREPAAAMNEELLEAQQAETTEEQTQELAQAAEQQEETADVLDLVAEHYRRLEEGLDAAETREQLREAEQELGLTEQIDQQYEQAQQLQQQMQQSPEQQLQELEAELAQNPAMQEALSEISRNALEEAQSALEEAAALDQDLQRANERSDESFQQQKRELAEDLRELGAEASRLSSALVNQAKAAAAQGKDAEAQQQLAKAQEKLNEAAAEAGSAREEELLEDLTEAAQNVQEALAEAAEMLQQAQQSSEQAAASAEAFPDEAQRKTQQTNSERQRQQFQEAQKKVANDLLKQKTDARNRAQQNQTNAAREVQNAENRVNQAQDQLNRSPENAGLQQNLANQQAAQEQAEAREELASHLLERAEAAVEQAQDRKEDADSPDQSALAAANPAAELAEQFSAEAAELAMELGNAAAALGEAADFADELQPSQNQLAAAENRQQQITEDVQQAADRVARASRHERRLNNDAAANPLEQAADEIAAAASNESTQAERQLDLAATEAAEAAAAEANEPAGGEPGQGDPANGQSGDQVAANEPQQGEGQPGTPEGGAAQPTNGQALQAQQDLAAAEAAFSGEAEDLSEILDPLQAAAADAAAAQLEAMLSGEPAAGDQPYSAAEQAAGQQLARRLDELDRQLAAAAAAAENPEGQPQPGQPQPGQPQSGQPIDSLAQAARDARAALAQSRQAAQQQALQALNQPGQQQLADNFSEAPDGGEFDVTAVDRQENLNWGRLRKQSAEDVARGRSERISEAYRLSVEAYFRVLAERAQQK